MIVKTQQQVVEELERQRDESPVDKTKQDQVYVAWTVALNGSEKNNKVARTLSDLATESNGDFYVAFSNLPSLDQAEVGGEFRNKEDADKFRKAARKALGKYLQ